MRECRSWWRCSTHWASFQRPFKQFRGSHKSTTTSSAPTSRQTFYKRRCVCVCVCGCVCGVRVCARVRAYVRATDCTHTHEHRHTHARTHTHMHVHTHVHTCTSIHKACSTEFQVSFPLRGLRVKTIAPAGAPAGAIVSCLYVCSCVSVSDAPLQRACGVSRLATECFLFLQENTFCLLLQENTFSEFH